MKVAFERTRFGGNLVSRLTLLPGAGDEGLNTVDLVEPRSPRYAALVLARAFEGDLLGQKIRIVTPEDFVLLKILSTREADIEDARSVLGALVGRVDVVAISSEAALLSKEIPDFDIAERLRRTLATKP